MAFSLSGAAVGANDALQQLLARRLEEQYKQVVLAQQQQQIDQRTQAEANEQARAQEQMAMQRRGFDADEAERVRVAARQAAIDAQTVEDRDIAAAERRDTKNKAGVRSLILEGMRAKTTDPRTAQLMAAGEGVEIDQDVLDPDKQARDQEARDERLHRQRMTENAAQESGRRQTELAKLGADKTKGVAGEYSQERARRTVQSVDQLIAKVSRKTTGVGSLLAKLPETDARNFAAELDTLKANIAFNELTQMREASKTGGALGAVSERELALLESTLGALDTGQSPDNLKSQLQQVRDSVTRWQLAKSGMAAPGRTGGAAGGGFQILSVED